MFFFCTNSQHQFPISVRPNDTVTPESPFTITQQLRRSVSAGRRSNNPHAPTVRLAMRLPLPLQRKKQPSVDYQKKKDKKKRGQRRPTEGGVRKSVAETGTTLTELGKQRRGGKTAGTDGRTDGCSRVKTPGCECTRLPRLIRETQVGWGSSSRCRELHRCWAAGGPRETEDQTSHLPASKPPVHHSSQQFFDTQFLCV